MEVYFEFREGNMRTFAAAISISALLTGSLFADGNSATEPASYEVKLAGDTPPTMDGVVSPGEWDAAEPAAGSWVNLRAETPDSHNLRFQMLWDDTYLYVLGQSDYDNFVDGVETEDVSFAPPNPDFNGGGYNPNFYFDPNTDNEALWPGDDSPSHPSTDGYQIAWDVYLGHAQRRPTEGSPDQSLRDPLDADGNSVSDYFGGLFLEAHANSAFGNQGAPGSSWARSDDGPNGNHRDDTLPGLMYAQTASNDDLNGTGAPGAVWEWQIPWTTFDATDPNKLVTAAEAENRPEMVVDDREFIVIPMDHPDFDPEFPDDEMANPDFGVEAPNVGQVPGTPAFIGNEGEPDLRFADPTSPVFIDNGLYAVDGPSEGDVWGFETSVITNDTANFLPSWSEPLGGDPDRSSFAPWGAVGHGQIKFVGGGETAICTIPEGGIAGDLDGDGTVAFADFLTLSTNFGATGTDYASGDIDCDGSVAFADFLVLSTNFGQTAGAQASSVPEPNSRVLLLIGGLVALSRRRRS